MDTIPKVKREEMLNLKGKEPHSLRSTIPGKTSWEVVKGPSKETSGLCLKLDFSDENFETPPMVLAQLIGSVDNWVMMTTVAEITEKSAVIYLRSTLPNYSPTPAEANKKNWHIVILFMRTAYSWPIKPYTVPCDNA